MFSQIITLFFLILAVVLAFFVLTAKNTLYAVLNLILIFLSIAVVLMLNGLEFLAFIYVIVYVGAVMVLFLWIVMTVPLKREFIYQSLLNPILLLLFTAIWSLFLIFLLDDLVVQKPDHEQIAFLLKHASHLPFSLLFHDKHANGNTMEAFRHLIAINSTLLLVSIFPHNGFINKIDPSLYEAMQYYLEAYFTIKPTISKSLLFLSIFPGLPQHIGFKALEANSSLIFEMLSIFQPEFNSLSRSKCFFLSILPFNPNSCNFLSIDAIRKLCYYNKIFEKINPSFLLTYGLAPFDISKCTKYQELNFLGFQALAQFKPYSKVFSDFYIPKPVFSPLFLLGIIPSSLEAMEILALRNEIYNTYPGLATSYASELSILVLRNLLTTFKNKPAPSFINFYLMSELLNNKNIYSSLFTFSPNLILLSIVPSNPSNFQFIVDYKQLMQFLHNLEIMDKNNIPILMMLGICPCNLATTDFTSIWLSTWMNQIIFNKSYDFLFSILDLPLLDYKETFDTRKLHRAIDNFSNMPMWIKLGLHAFLDTVDRFEYFRNKVMKNSVLSQFWTDAIALNDSWFPKNFGEIIYLFLIEIVVLLAYLLLIVIVGIVGLSKFSNKNTKPNNSSIKNKIE